MRSSTKPPAGRPIGPFQANQGGRIATIMMPFHARDNKSRATLDNMLRRGAEADRWEDSEAKDAMLQAVQDALPPTPWPKNIHKTIATQLGITNRKAHDCINELVERGVWPELVGPGEQINRPRQEGDAGN
jgi:hypothetical protein